MCFFVCMVHHVFSFVCSVIIPLHSVCSNSNEWFGISFIGSFFEYNLIVVNRVFFHKKMTLVDHICICSSWTTVSSSIPSFTYAVFHSWMCVLLCFLLWIVCASLHIPSLFSLLWILGCWAGYRGPSAVLTFSRPMILNKTTYERFHKWGYPKWIVYRKLPIKIDDLGIPLFQETIVWTSQKPMPTEIIIVARTNKWCDPLQSVADIFA